MDETDPVYHPIDCGLHDEVEAAATRGDIVRVVYATPEGAEVTEARVVDVGARGGAEYLRLSTGVEVRLDHVLELDGVRFRDR